MSAGSALWFDATLTVVIIAPLVCALAGFFYGNRVMRFIKDLWGWT